MNLVINGRLITRDEGAVLIIALAALVPGDESSVDDQIHVCSSL